MKFLNEFIPELPSKIELLFAYSPDVEWVAAQAGKCGDAEELAQVIQDSLSRPEVTRRDRSAEDMKRML